MATMMKASKEPTAKKSTKGPKKNLPLPPKQVNPGAVNVSFAQTPATNGIPASGTPAPTPGNNGVLSALTFCFNCRLHGHIARFCPSPRTAGGVQGMQFGITLAQLDGELTGNDLISPDWILLDSGLTVSSIKNIGQC
jgi:hypothetical protein